MTIALGYDHTKGGPLAQDRNRVVLSSTTETTLIAAVAGTNNVLVDAVIANLSAANPVQVDFRDTTGGSIIFSVNLAANSSMPVNSAMGLRQAAVNTNWTAKATGTSPNVAITANSFRDTTV